MKEVKPMVEIYTDGACRGNPGPGGWGVLLRYQDSEKELSGAVEHTTNNQMELMAAIEALNALLRPSKVDLYTDSEYVKQGITTWIHTWKKKQWKNAAGQPVKNKALWQQLYEATLRHEIAWYWVKGHSNHPDNDRADALARDAIDRLIA
ncbi:MAG: ribonuclease HI [Gammaproteobacteria bacterium]|nr:ribonuclease HI [Gammaproteobacteria bacterium]MBP9729516.1 ribonuclease HI [Gammaproteobacteria bacterium]